MTIIITQNTRSTLEWFKTKKLEPVKVTVLPALWLFFRVSFLFYVLLFFNILFNFSENSEWLLMKKIGIFIYEWEELLAYANKKCKSSRFKCVLCDTGFSFIGLNGDCWALVEVWALLGAILVCFLILYDIKTVYLTIKIIICVLEKANLQTVTVHISIPSDTSLSSEINAPSNNLS